jgi:hypothetical protein
VPDGDLFNAIKAGKVSIVTDTIDTFTATGIRLTSGRELPADIIVTATGLRMRLMSGVQLDVDGTPVDLGQTLTYRGFMFSGVPNLAQAIGYTNASWTLKCELIAQYICRLLNYMDAHGYAECLPQRPAGMPGVESAVGLYSGYVARAHAWLPSQGPTQPWRTYNNYFRDLMLIRFGAINDGTMRFSRLGAADASSPSMAASPSTTQGHTSTPRGIG